VERPQFQEIAVSAARRHVDRGRADQAVFVEHTEENAATIEARVQLVRVGVRPARDLEVVRRQHHSAVAHDVDVVVHLAPVDRPVQLELAPLKFSHQHRENILACQPARFVRGLRGL
jgi:hypothetical protein